MVVGREKESGSDSGSHWRERERERERESAIYYYNLWYFFPGHLSPGVHGGRVTDSHYYTSFLVFNTVIISLRNYFGVPETS